MQSAIDRFTQELVRFKATDKGIAVTYPPPMKGLRFLTVIVPPNMFVEQFKIVSK